MPKIVVDEEIYQAVMQVVLERGYAGATTKQMAQAAGVSEVTLFRKFKSKSNLIKQAITWLAGQMDFETSVRYTGDVSDDLLRIVHAYQDSIVKYGAFLAVILAEMRRNSELAGIIDRPVQIFSALEQLLARYQAEGVLEPEHPLHALAALLGPLIYAALTGIVFSVTPTPPVDLAQHVHRFLHGRQIGAPYRKDPTSS